MLDRSGSWVGPLSKQPAAIAGSSACPPPLPLPTDHDHLLRRPSLTPKDVSGTPLCCNLLTIPSGQSRIARALKAARVKRSRYPTGGPSKPVISFETMRYARARFARSRLADPLSGSVS
jgi:hypothetical protein